MTDDFEQQLHDKLDARANAIAVTDELGDVFERSSRKSRNTIRALSFALVLVVCASAIGLVVATRGDDARPVAKAKTKSGTATLQATGASIPVVAAAGGPTFASAGTALSKPNTVYADNGVNAAQLFFTAGNDQPMAKVFTRTTGTGVAVRAYRANTSNNASGPPWWTPPGWCYPNGYVLADVSDGDIAVSSYGSLYASQHDGSQLGGTVSIVGQAEQHVRWVVVAQGPANAARIRATFPNGSSDEMAPVGGVAVLVGTGPQAPKELSAQLEAFDASGRTLGKTKVDGVTSSYLQLAPGANVTILKDRDACSAPQTLPAPGKQQPADATAARQAVTDRFNAAYKHGITDADFAASFDDAHGFADVMKKLRSGSFKQQVESAQMKLNDVVFLDPTTAAIQYEIDVPNYGTPSFAPRFNEAHLVNGQWKLARAGWCNDVSLAGVQCPS